MAGREDRDHAPLAGDGRVFFDAVLHPHRSLTRRGFTVVMAVTAAGLFAVGLLFLLLGAWPVIGFCGLELLLLYIAFRVSFRDARAAERIRLSDAGLEVSRVTPAGAVAGHWRFPPNWLRVTLDEPPQHDSKLLLSSHGRSVVIGRFLTPDERAELAEALRAALDRWRCRPNPCAAA
ncbi:MAG: DUF2244 domain-containing protein [Alphaproteobacteria bacterium]|nr:DUF2244 domain-containing protein [Alphaproteobacteria bacterium]